MAHKRHDDRQPIPTAYHYSYRPSGFGGPTVHVWLDEDELVFRSPGDPEQHVGLGSIRRMRLRRPQSSSWFYSGFSFTLVLEDRREYRIKGPPVLFVLFGPGFSFWTDPTGTYTPFLLTLHRALIAHRAQIDFRTRGIPGPFNVAWLAGVAFVLLIGYAGIPLRLYHFVLILLGARIWSLWPVKYEPDAIPKSFLPS